MESLKILVAVVLSLGTASAATVSPQAHTHLHICEHAIATNQSLVAVRVFDMKRIFNAAFLPSYPQLGVVRTEGGQVQGKNIPLGLFRSVDVFKGIPFAAKPGLFEKPKAHPGWDGV